MSQHPEYSDGAPCWADLSTPDLAGAMRFYGALLGWSFDAPRPELNNYVTCRRDGQSVAGLMKAQPDMPIAWGVWLKSSDLEATARRITGAGGKVLMPGHAAAELGRMLVALDVNGAFLGVWEPGQHRGAERFDEPGAMCWNELYTRDGAAADRFYREVFGYQQAQMGDPREMDYMMYSCGGPPVCGRMQTDDGEEDPPSGWWAVFVVEDMDVAIATVRALDGKLVRGPVESEFGRIARVRDPYGAGFKLAQRPAR